MNEREHGVTEHEHRGFVPTRRLEALADGVFAIAATLLILDVTTTGAPLSGELVRISPSYAAYFVTFISIGIAWINHGTVISLVDRTDRTFLVLNLFLLAFVGFIPFPTRLLAVHLFDADAQAAVLAYGITLFAASLFFNAIWFYGVLGRGLLSREADAHLVEGISRSYMPGPLLFGAATLVAIFLPVVSAVLFAAIVLFYLVEATVFARG
ncbi:MAG TPA: TMEM175 family protein [Candidatus Acidoferrales bacterium]|nr:TMEM175 family protein [Candidatus Acidoferrales bacterium]